MKKLNPSSDDRKLVDRLIPDPAHGHLLGFFATTYEMQSEFFETDFLPTMLGLGAWDDRNWTSRIALEKNLAELEAATMLLDARPYRRRPRSLRVEVVPVALEAVRILHAKILLGVYEKSVKLMVGSANLTEPGYRRKREIVAVLTGSAQRPAEAKLIAGAIRYMDDILSQWMTTSASQLQDLALERLDEWAVEKTNEDKWFVWGGGKQALWRQFLDHWPTTDQVEQITIVSPFWSEEDASGPIVTFVTTLQESDNLVANAKLLLLTEAAPDKQATYKPKLPESFSDFDARSIGIDASALAVDPRVAPEEVGMGDEFTGTRSLHAKVVLLEGANTSLIFIGSANFTRHGWGFLPDPLRANIEAGLIVRRSGLTRSALRNLVPETTGDAVPLTGAASGRLALPDPLPDELPWPAFLREVLLAPAAKKTEQLDLVVTVTDTAAGAWSILHLPTDDAPRQLLLKVAQPVKGTLSYRVSLSKDNVERLLREQEVHVEWWQCSEGRSFPINVAADTRIVLPISPSTGRPEEQHLIAYYQGRITWEDLFPDPEPGRDKKNHDPDDRGCVDTSRIQSYIVRDFVEALKGIRDDLKSASQSPKACMRLALLGSVSPVALAKRVVEAADIQKRTPTASGFQLVEILACLDEAKHYEAATHFRAEWLSFVDEAAAEVDNMLDKLKHRYLGALSQNFQRYSKSVRQYHLGEAIKQ